MDKLSPNLLPGTHSFAMADQCLVLFADSIEHSFQFFYDTVRGRFRSILALREHRHLIGESIQLYGCFIGGQQSDAYRKR